MHGSTLVCSRKLTCEHDVLVADAMTRIGCNESFSTKVSKLSRSHELLFRSRELLFRSHGIRFRSHKIVIRSSVISFTQNINNNSCANETRPLISEPAAVDSAIARQAAPRQPVGWRCGQRAAIASRICLSSCATMRSSAE